MQPDSRSRSTRGLATGTLWILICAAAVTSAFYLALPEIGSSMADRLFLGNPMKPLSVGLFLWAMTALAWRGFGAINEWRMLGRGDWDRVAGQPNTVAEAFKLFAPGGVFASDAAGSRVARHISNVLVEVPTCGASEGLEERLDRLAERDARRLDASYESIRTLGRVIPALGILGTLISISAASTSMNSTVAPYDSLNVLSAISSACDTAMLALLLWIPLVFAKGVVWRLEHSILARVDQVAKGILRGCMVRHSPESQAFLGVVDGVSRVILQATRDAWREQGQLWSRTVEQAGESQIAAMEAAVQKFVEQMAQVVANQDAQFHKFLEGLDTLRQLSQKSLADVASKMTAHQIAAKRQVELLGQLVADEGRVSNLQRSLNENLAALANVQALDQAIHSLTAATHLLTARSGRAAPESRPLRGNEPKTGVAA